MSSLTTRDKRALMLLALVSVPTLIWYFGFSEDVAPATPVVTGAVLPVPVLEKRLQTLRQQAALNPAKQEVREALQAAIEDRENRLMRAETAQQVQAELLAKVRGVLQSQDPPMIARQSDLGEIRRLDDHYGEVAISVGFGCTVEQLVNVLADLAALEEMAATRQLNVIAADRAKKTLNVRLTMTALMPAALAPETSGGLLP